MKMKSMIQIQIVWDGEESEEELEGNEEYVDRGEWEEDTPEVSEEHVTNEEQQWQESKSTWKKKKVEEMMMMKQKFH